MGEPAAEPIKVDENTRLEFLDMLRGICVVLMVVYHALYLLAQYFTLGKAFAANLFDSLQPMQVTVASMFIMISGFSAQLSAKPKLRAGLLVCMAAIISGVTILVLPRVGIPNTAIWFGILHLLACGKLAYAYGKKLFDKLPGILGLPVCLFLFFYTAPVGQRFFGILGMLRVNLPAAWYNQKWLFFLGIKSPSFVSWDFFPLLPWVFLFFFGVFVGKMIKRDQLPMFCYKKRPILGFVGRSSLVIYLAHVPLLYGLFTLIALFAK